MNRSCASALAVIALVSLGLTGCASYSKPRYASDGVYYEHPRHYQPATRVHVINPVIYPYWSIDYFYFSRHYHPYSVLVHYYDPWYYPYPGWYYGYRPGPRTRIGFSYGYYYPWYAFGSHYHYYRPWHTTAHFSYWHYRPAKHHQHPSHDRVRMVDERLRQMEQRQAQAARADRRQHGPVPAVSQRIPATARRHAGEQSGDPAEIRQRHAPPRQPETSERERLDPSIVRQRLQAEPRVPPPPRTRSTAPRSRDATPEEPPARIRQHSESREQPGIRHQAPQTRPSVPVQQRGSPPISREASPTPPVSRPAPERSRPESPPPTQSAPQRSRSTSPPPSRSAPQRSSRQSGSRQRDRDHDR